MNKKLFFNEPPCTLGVTPIPPPPLVVPLTSVTEVKTTLLVVATFIRHLLYKVYLNTDLNLFGFQAILFLGQLVVSYIFAFILSIAFEAPIVSLLKLVSPTKRNNHR